MEAELLALVTTVRAYVNSVKSGPNVTAFAALLSRIRVAEARLISRSQCLPLKLTMEMLGATQRLWASTMHRGTVTTPDVSADLTRARCLITHLFLLAHNFFAPAQVRDEYLRHHLSESEKAVLMCLQTAKRVTRDQMPEAARELLTIAGAVVDACAREKSFNSQLAVEVAFAKLLLAWNAAEPTGAVMASAESLVGLIHGNRVYQELFLQFVLTSCREPAGTAHVALNEEAYRGLLTLALRVVDESQPGATPASAKSRTFRGSTFLELALSYLRDANYAAAATAATTAASLLDTTEPLVAQLSATAHLGLSDDAFRLFVELVGRASTPSSALMADELLALATDLIETIPALSQPVATFLIANYVPTSEAAAHLPLVFAFLLRANTAFCAHEMVRLLGDESVPVADHARYYFSCLCSLHKPQREPAPFPRATVIHALSVALRRFAREGASLEENEDVLVELARLTLSGEDGAKTAEGHAPQVVESLQSVLELFDAHVSQAADSHGAEIGAVCRVLHARLLFTMGRAEDALAIARGLLALSDVTMQRAALGSLVNDRLDQNDATAASDVAELWLTSAEPNPSAPSGAILVEVARVYVVGLLTRYEARVAHGDDLDAARESVSTALLDLLLERVAPALSDLVSAHALDLTLLEWWCNVFCHVAHLVKPDRLSAAVALSHAAVEWSDTGGVANSHAVQRAIAVQRVQFLLEMEFDLFVAGCAWLPIPQLESHATRLLEWLSAGATPPASLWLARAELAVRRAVTESLTEAPGHGDGSSDLLARLTAHGEQLKSHGATTDDLEAFAAALLHYSRLSPALEAPLAESAAKVELLALQLPLSEGTAGGRRAAVNALVCYKAYQMTRHAADRLGIVTHALDALRTVAAASAAEALVPQEEATMLECIGEYFTVEAWNTVVRHNASHDRPATLQWREMATALAETLTPASVARSAVLEFASKMTLL